MKKIIFLLAFTASSLLLSAQHPKNLYDTSANAPNDIAKAIKMAAKENKHVLLMGGGNWCSWCRRFNEFMTTDKQLDSIVKADYVLYHLNFSKENKNQETFAKYGFAQRFGFPVFIVLDQKGERLHTQNSGLLEEGKGYKKEKVMDFFLQWNRKAVDANSYME